MWERDNRYPRPFHTIFSTLSYPLSVYTFIFLLDRPLANHFCPQLSRLFPLRLSRLDVRFNPHGADERCTAKLMDATAKQVSFSARNSLHERFTTLCSYRWRYLCHCYTHSPRFSSDTGFGRSCARLLLTTYSIPLLCKSSSVFRTLESC